MDDKCNSALCDIWEVWLIQRPNTTGQFLSTESTHTNPSPDSAESTATPSTEGKMSNDCDEERRQKSQGELWTNQVYPMRCYPLRRPVAKAQRRQETVSSRMDERRRQTQSSQESYIDRRTHDGRTDCDAKHSSGVKTPIVHCSAERIRCFRTTIVR